VTAVVFDFGAVLFQWQPMRLLQQTVPELAPDEAAPARWRRASSRASTSSSDWAQFDLGKVDEAALAERIGRRIGVAPALIRRVIDGIPAHLQPQGAAVALLRRLRAAGHRMYYLSNMPEPYAAHLENENGFVGEFADGIFSARVGLMKPQPEIFALAVSRFALDPAQTLFIDDHAGNIAAARAQGWQGLRFIDAAQCAADLTATGWLADSAG
jgi:putative hydrolase of the HAD superfamily